MIQPSDIYTLTDFKRHSTELLGLLSENRRPQVLTVEGKPRAVLVAVEAFEKLTLLAERAEAIEGIRRGLEDVDSGRTMPLDQFEASVRKQLGLEVDR